MTQARIYSLDAARFLFALLVVCMHVPNIGENIIAPLLATAVPFFFLITGYFLFDTNPKVKEKKIKVSLRNYSTTWAKYFIILTTFLVLLRIYLGVNFDITSKDIVDLFIFCGNARFFDVISINGVIYGVSALWFLWGGAMSLIISYLTRKYIDKTWYLCIIILFYIISVYLNRDGSWHATRTIAVSLPYLYAGYRLKSYLLLNKLSFSSRSVAIVTIAALALLYAEYFLFPCNCPYAKFFLLPVSVVLFYDIIRMNELPIWNKLSCITKIPNKVTLDIYIWHRFVYMCMAGLLAINFHGLDAVAIYLICLTTSILIRMNTRKISK